MSRVFYIYMIVVGLGARLLLVLVPETRDFFIRPYFWLLIAVGLFDLALLALGRGGPGGLLTMNARLIGFVLGGVLLVLVPTIAGAPVTFF